MMMKGIYIGPTVLLILMLSSSALSAQEGQAMDSTMMDFWVGTWDLSWDDPNGDKGTGTNEVHRFMDDHVICENFEATGGINKGFRGKSWSVYNKRIGRWKQTWVDNQGSYLDFTGYRDGKNIIFSRSVSLPGGKEIHQRMVFHDIKKNSLTWDWENSQDGGESWQLLWQINYTRRK